MMPRSDGVCFFNESAFAIFQMVSYFSQVRAPPKSSYHYHFGFIFFIAGAPGCFEWEKAAAGALASPHVPFVST